MKYVPHAAITVCILSACASTGSHDGEIVELDGELAGMRIRVEEHADSGSLGLIPADIGRTKVDSRSQVSIVVSDAARDGLRELDRLLDDYNEKLDEAHARLRGARAAFRRGELSPEECDACVGALDEARRATVPIEWIEIDELRTLAATEDDAQPDIGVRILAQKTDGTPLYVYNWTEGEKPTGSDESIQAQIDRIEAKKSSTETKEERYREEASELREELRGGGVPDAPDDPHMRPLIDNLDAIEANEPATRGFMAAPGAAPEASTMAEAALTGIRRSIGAFLPPGRIELGLTDVERGDKLDLAVEFTRREDGQPDRTLTEREFLLEVDDFGWRAHVRPQLIFFRSTDGSSDEKKFQSNAAALIDWSYRYRDPDDWWAKVVNSVEPGVGIHVASLDQGDSSLEVGTGLSVSFKQGLVSLGWGYNLSERDHYYFIGGNLFQLFDKLGDVVSN